MSWQECGVCYQVFEILESILGKDVSFCVLGYITDTKYNMVCTKQTRLTEKRTHIVTKQYLDYVDVSHLGRETVHPHKIQRVTYITYD